MNLASNAGMRRVHASRERFFAQFVRFAREALHRFPALHARGQ